MSMNGEAVIPGVKVHPLAAEFPLLEGDEFNQLVESIERHGIQTRIILLHHDGSPVVVDGRNRVRAWKVLADQGKVEADGWRESCEYVSRTQGGADDADHVRSVILAANIHRRHLTPAQRAAITLRMMGEQIEAETTAAKATSTAKAGKASGAARSASNVTPKPESRSPKRDRKASNARSKAGKVAANANVSRHVAEQAVAADKAEKEGRLPKGTMQAVEEGTKPLSDAVKEAKPAKGKANKPTAGESRRTNCRLATKVTLALQTVRRAVETLGHSDSTYRDVALRELQRYAGYLSQMEFEPSAKPEKSHPCDELRAAVTQRWQAMREWNKHWGIADMKDVRRLFLELIRDEQKQFDK